MARGFVNRSQIGTVILGLYLVQSAYIGVSANPGLRAARAASSGGFVPGVLALLLFVVSVVASLVLVKLHNTAETRWLLWLHIATAAAAVLLGLFALARHSSHERSYAGGATRVLGLSCLGRSGWPEPRPPRSR